MNRFLTVLAAGAVWVAALSECLVQDFPCLAAALLGGAGVAELPKDWRPRVCIVAVFLFLAALQCRGASPGIPLALAASGVSALLLLVPRRLCFTLSAMACGVFLLCHSAYFAAPHDGGRTAFLQRGGWGVSLPHDDTINIASQYSYDVLKTFLGSHDIDTPLRLGAEDSACWVITPTHPVSAEEAEHLLRWVEDGGRLYLVTDHTNLFGHRDALSEVWARAGITCRDDVVITQTDESRYLAPTGYFEGMSANTLGGKGEPFLWQWGYRERADYMGRCFFSDNQITDEDEWGVYPAGLVTKHGRGVIVTMADSTLFANFALAFPSAQALLAATLDARPFPLRLMAGLLLTLLPLVRRSPRTAVLLFLAGGVVWLAWPRTNLHTTLPTIGLARESVSFQGDRACALASAYAASPRFPLWEDAGATLPPVPTGETSPEWKGALLSMEAPHPDILLAQTIADMARHSVWFDAGIGPLREAAARRFWHKVCGEEEPPFRLGEAYICEADYITKGTDAVRVRCRVAPVQGSDEWVIVGSGCVGRMVDGHTILLKKEWQPPFTDAEDALLQIHDETVSTAD